MGSQIKALENSVEFLKGVTSKYNSQFLEIKKSIEEINSIKRMLGKRMQKQLIGRMRTTTNNPLETDCNKVQHHKHLSTKKQELDSFLMRSTSKDKKGDVLHCGQPFGPMHKCPEKGMSVMILHSCLKMKTWLRTGTLSKLKGEMTSRNSYVRSPIST
ncbi:hypothetical protein E2542_SST29156 [Spatholobus suberectus]|nr:hypothetical protein E2542_SST29156 [Spatholobus suberectus]